MNNINIYKIQGIGKSILLAISYILSYAGVVQYNEDKRTKFKTIPCYLKIDDLSFLSKT